jgi:hypothetical protein
VGSSGRGRTHEHLHTCAARNLCEASSASARCATVLTATAILAFSACAALLMSEGAVGRQMRRGKFLFTPAKRRRSGKLKEPDIAHTCAFSSCCLISLTLCCKASVCARWVLMCSAARATRTSQRCTYPVHREPIRVSAPQYTQAHLPRLSLPLAAPPEQLPIHSAPARAGSSRCWPARARH